MTSQSTSTAALVVGNLLPIVGVLLWGWDVSSVCTLYWAENLILGAIMLLKMMYRGGWSALGDVLFFLVHYGAFCIAHSALIAELFMPAVRSAEDSLFAPAMAIFDVASPLWWWAFVGLVVSHLVSLVVNWWGQKEYRGETMGSLMTAPYRRLMILHAAVLMGGLAVEQLGSPVYLVVVLVLIKIGVDIVIHRREHRMASFAAHAAADRGVIVNSQQGSQE